jgi:hypothetical protein
MDQDHQLAEDFLSLDYVAAAAVAVAVIPTPPLPEPGCPLSFSTWAAWVDIANSTWCDLLPA